MSAAAEKSVNACTHPKVKGAVRALYKAIADHVPEGQTTTPPMTLYDLALAAQHTGRTAQTCRNVLEALDLVKVHDGGRGRKARYQMLQLTSGTPPFTPAPLPLIGPAKPPRTNKQRSGKDLFSAADPQAGEETAIKVGNFFRTFLAKVGSVLARYDQTAIRVGSFVRSWWPRTIKQRSGKDPTFGSYQLDRARDVRTTTTTTGTTTSAARGDEKPTSCRWHGTSHAWCDFRGEHVPMQLHKELRRKLARQPGETDADLDATLYARYAEIARAIPETQPLDTHENGFAFWKRMLRAAATSTPATAPDEFAQAAEERRQRWGGRS